MRRVATATATVSAFALLLFSGYGATQTSPDSRETESQLTALKASIATVRAQLEAQEEARDDLQDTLRETEQLIGDLDRQLSLDGGILADIAPTLLDMMGIAIPKAMSGRSLLLP